MSGPDRIFAKPWKHATHTEVGVWSATHHVGTVEYIRRAPEALAALPEVQALIAEAVKAEREACAQAAHDAVTHPSAYASREAIRKRGEGQP